MPEPKLPKTIKKFNPNDSNPCSGCSNCCEYVVIHIDKPKTVEDFSDIYWYIIHRDVFVYVDWDGDWNVQFNTPCDNLKDRRCGIYPKRPTVCRDYQPSDCPRYNVEPPEKHLFRNDTDLFEYLNRKRPKLFRKFAKKHGVKTTDLLPEHN